MKRRHFLFGMAGLGVAVAGAGAGARYWPSAGLWNPCPQEAMPAELSQHEVLQAVWEGIDTSQVWDSHVHLIGLGDSDSGIWINPNMRSLLHPIQYVQFQFYLNAACTAPGSTMDEGVIQRLITLNQGLRPGTKLMLLAFDYHYDPQGQRVLELSPFHTPNEYAARMAAEHPEHFEWIASIHPYREDAIETLRWAVTQGARAVKWLPGAMGIDTDSPRSHRFYDEAIRLNIPLLVHAGAEQAVHVEGAQNLGNPLLLRPALDRGVKIIIAHCASLGRGVDLDQGPQGREIGNFELFARLMDDPHYESNLFADISAVTQINRDTAIIGEIIQRQAWHPRLLNGSDYPLPGVMPLFSLATFVKAGYLPEAEAQLLDKMRIYNPLFFDIALKRRLHVGDLRLSPQVFETRRKFTSTGSRVNKIEDGPQDTEGAENQ